MKHLIISLCVGFISLFANNLQNNQTIILSSNSTYEYAKHSFDYLSTHLQNQPSFIIKSDSGYFMLTTGIYSNKEAVYAAMKKLPAKLKELKPFRGTMDFDLNSQDKRILLAANLITTTPPQASKTLQYLDKKTTQDQTIEPIVKKESQWIDSMSISYGQNSENYDVYRIALQKNFKNRYLESPTGYVSGYYDFSLNQIEYSSDVHTLALTPIFAYYFKTEQNFQPYIYGGIGAAYISRTRVDEKDFATSFQFEDQLGLGLQSDDIDFQLGYIHYSNASIKSPNDGMDIGIFSLRFHF